MYNFAQEGNVLEFTAPSGGVTVGVGVKIGSRLVFPTVTAAEAAKFNGVVRGVVYADKLAAQAWTEGAVVYWDDSESEFTTVSSTNYLAGVAAKAADNPSEHGYVLLNDTSLPAAS